MMQFVIEQSLLTVARMDLPKETDVYQLMAVITEEIVRQQEERKDGE